MRAAAPLEDYHKYRLSRKSQVWARRSKGHGRGGEGREVVEEGEGAEGVERLVGVIEVGVVNLVRRGQSNFIEFILYLAV